MTYVVSDVGGGGRSSFHCCPSVVSDVEGTGMASGGRLASFGLVVSVRVSVRVRVRVRVWVKVWVRVRVRTLTTLSLPLGPSSSHLSHCCRPLKPTAMQRHAHEHAKQDKTRQGKTRQDKTRQDKTTKTKT